MNNYKDHLWVVILAGGGGTRLWPLSREKNPKQFIKLFEKKTLLQVTVQRLSRIVSWQRIFIVTTSPLYAREIASELPRLSQEHILTEPAKRNTAIAHGLAAVYIKRLDPNAVIINEYADHVVSPISKYLKTFLVAAQVAYQTNNLVAIGIKPEYPHSGMGHIKMGKVKRRIDNVSVFRVEKYVEKPPLALARSFTKSGDYLWNGGMYVWRADSILKSLRLHAPKIAQGLSKIQEAIGETNEKEIMLSVYKKVPSISVDYAVSEREKKLLVLRADFNWIDVGDWNVVWELLRHDSNGNAIIHLNKRGEWVEVDTQDTLVQTDKLLIATVGVRDLVIVETDDAILIANRNKSQLVKEMVTNLKQEKKEKFL